MSEATIFVIGSVIFAITVAGSVMAGGLTIGRMSPDEDAATPSDAAPSAPPRPPA